MKPWTDIASIMKCRLCGKEITNEGSDPGYGKPVHRLCAEANTRAAQAGGRR